MQFLCSYKKDLSELSCSFSKPIVLFQY